MIIPEAQIPILRTDLNKVREQCASWHQGMRLRNRINAVFKAFEDEEIEATHEVLIVQVPLPGSTRVEPLLINICLMDDHIMMMEVDPKVELRFGVWLASVEDPWRLSSFSHKLAWNSGLDVNESDQRAPTVEEATCFKQLRHAYRGMVQACLLRHCVPAAGQLRQAPRL